MIRRQDFSSKAIQAECYILENEKLRVEILNYGARIKAIYAKDRYGIVEDVVLGFDTIDEYAADHAYFGALVGRCAGRIANGRFAIDEDSYTLACNNGKHHLHGGVQGFSFQVFEATILEDGVLLQHTSKHMEEGYPGTLTVSIIYRLKNDTLHLEYMAKSDRTTIVNLTNHSYFNLHGAGNKSVDSHILQIASSQYYPNDAHFLPSTATLSVQTPFDFQQGKPLSFIFQDTQNPQIKQANGLDHYVCFLPKTKTKVSVYEPSNGRCLKIVSDQSGAQIYTPNYDTPIIGKHGKKYQGRCAICIETQTISNSINRGECTVFLKPNETYTQHTAFRFTCKGE